MASAQSILLDFYRASASRGIAVLILSTCLQRSCTVIKFKFKFNDVDLRAPKS